MKGCFYLEIKEEKLMSLPFVVKVMPYRIKYFTESGDYNESIVLGKNIPDAIEVLLNLNNSSLNETIIETVELIRLQEGKVLITK